MDSEEPGWVEKALELARRAGRRRDPGRRRGRAGGAALGAIAPGGRFSAPARRAAASPDDQAAADANDVHVVGIRGAELAAGDRVRLTGDVLAELRAGRLAPVIGQLPLERIAEAHAAIEEQERLREDARARLARAPSAESDRERLRARGPRTDAARARPPGTALVDHEADAFHADDCGRRASLAEAESQSLPSSPATSAAARPVAGAPGVIGEGHGGADVAGPGSNGRRRRS